MVEVNDDSYGHSLVRTHILTSHTYTSVGVQVGPWAGPLLGPIFVNLRSGPSTISTRYPPP